jgi:hypothetical protein
VPSDSEADVQPVAVATASGDQNISYFYSSLAPYGSWISVDGGWCWRPTCAVTEVKWRPYCHRGHWVYTDWGWTWQSDYSWGWAPFHYGRWELQAGYGWIWHPDNVWGPAWVNWRNHEGNYGWAPLPPRARFEVGVGFSFDGRHVDVGFDFGLTSRDYCFVPGEHFCDHNLLEFRIHHHDIVTFYDRAEVIRTSYEFQHDRFLNHGPDYKRIEVVTRREIKPIRIVDAEFKRGERLRGAVVTAEGLSVYRPKIEAKVTVTPNEVVLRRQTVLQQREEARLEAQKRLEQQRAATAVRERERQARQAAIEAEHHKAAVEEARRERERVETFAKQEENEQRRHAMEQAAVAQREREEQAREKQREAEARAEQHRKAAEEAARENERRAQEAARQREQMLQRQREAVNESIKNAHRTYIENQRQNLQDLREGEKRR